MRFLVGFGPVLHPPRRPAAGGRDSKPSISFNERIPLNPPPHTRSEAAGYLPHTPPGPRAVFGASSPCWGGAGAASRRRAAPRGCPRLWVQGTAVGGGGRGGAVGGGHLSSPDCELYITPRPRRPFGARSAPVRRPFGARSAGARRARGGDFIDFSGWNWLEPAVRASSRLFEPVRTGSNSLELARTAGSSQFQPLKSIKSPPRARRAPAERAPNGRRTGAERAPNGRRGRGVMYSSQSGEER